jgi:hypothetical protein
MWYLGRYVVRCCFLLWASKIKGRTTSQTILAIDLKAINSLLKPNLKIFRSCKKRLFRLVTFPNIYWKRSFLIIQRTSF